MSKSRTDKLFAFIAETARLLPGATFHDAKNYCADGTGRIRVKVGSKNKIFVVDMLGAPNDASISTPQDVVDHFSQFIRTWISRNGYSGSAVDVWMGQPTKETESNGHIYYSQPYGGTCKYIWNSPLSDVSVDELGYGECREVAE